jgi:hypothetical protein
LMYLWFTDLFRCHVYRWNASPAAHEMRSHSNSSHWFEPKHIVWRYCFRGVFYYWVVQWLITAIWTLDSRGAENWRTLVTDEDIGCAKSSPQAFSWPRGDSRNLLMPDDAVCSPDINDLFTKSHTHEKDGLDPSNDIAFRVTVKGFWIS